MGEEFCKYRERLIDYVDGDVSQEEKEAIEEHLAACAECAAYVESVKRVYELASRDRVPEPPPAYWLHFLSNVRRRATERRRRLIFVLAPGIAAIAVVVLLVAYFAGGERIDPYSYLVTDLTGEAGSVYVGDEFIVSEIFSAEIDQDLDELDEYLMDRESLIEIIDSLDEDERQEFVTTLMGVLNRQGNLIQSRDYQRREC